MSFVYALLFLQSKRDILSETKYIELVLVADHKEVMYDKANVRQCLLV